MMNTGGGSMDKKIPLEAAGECEKLIMLTGGKEAIIFDCKINKKGHTGYCHDLGEVGKLRFKIVWWPKASSRPP